MARPRLPSREEVSSATPLRLEVAAAIAFPDGSMTASGLRRERARGRLVVERIAGKDYTTLASIERMRELCRVVTKDPVSIFARRELTGQGHHRSVWIIRDGNSQTSTVCFAHDIDGAERALAAYLADKHTKAARAFSREPNQIPIADILTIYVRDVVPGHSRPKETKGRMKPLDAFFGDKMLSYVTGETCRAYVKQRSTDAAARRELEDLRAAINHHRREGLCTKVVEVLLPSE